MIRPADIDDITWEVLTAADSGDVAAMRRLLAEDPARSQSGYFYTPAIHFAVREGHTEIVQMLLDAGADSEWNGHYGASLIDLAKERDHDDVVRLLEEAPSSAWKDSAGSNTRGSSDPHRGTSRRCSTSSRASRCGSIARQSWRSRWRHAASPGRSGFGARSH